jgi:hypothetical protein
LEEAKKHTADIEGEIIELKNHVLNPCRDCMKCLDSRRCATDDTFNQLYEKIIACDILFIVSPHYAPIPAKLCILLEKMEEITFYRWERDTSYQSEVYGIKTALIAHGGGSDNEVPQGEHGISQKDYKKVVNDPIANALRTIQFDLIPFSDEWDTGIVVPPDVSSGSEHPPDKKIGQYVRKVLESMSTG